MNLYDHLNAEIITALKQGEKERLEVLRFFKNSVDNAAKKGLELNNELIVATAQTEIKRRKEAASLYKEAGAQDKAEKEENEVIIISEFLPEQMTEAEIKQLVVTAIAETGASSMQDMGKVMAILKDKIAGKADMGQVSQSVRDQLS